MSFFFQAEDGIRDFHVTGVQTCALPISDLLFNGYSVGRWDGDTLYVDTVGFSPATVIAAGIPHGEKMHIKEKIWRSEERRVGKECGSRCWPYDAERKGRTECE